MTGGRFFRLCVFISAMLFTPLFGCENNRGDDTGSTAPESGTESDFSIEAFGVVKVTRERTITIEFPATIVSVHTTAGERVTAGTDLITLDLRPYENQQAALQNKIQTARLRLDQVQTDYDRSGATASSDYRKLENSIVSAQREIDQLSQEYDELRSGIVTKSDPEMRKLSVDFEQAKKDLETAEGDLNVKNAMHKDGFVPDKELERERNSVEALRSRVEGLELSIESLENRRKQELDRLRLSISQKSIGAENLQIQAEQLAGPEVINIEIQKAQIAAYEQEMEQLLSLARMPFITGNRIISDVENGIVNEITGSEGESALNGVTLVKILDLDTLVVEAGVPEEFIKEIHLESVASIKPLADPDRSYIGKVVHIAGMARSRGGETIVDVMLELIDHDGFLIPNFNVDIEFSPEQSEEMKTDEPL